MEFETMPTQKKKPVHIYITEEEIQQLKKQSKEMSKILNQKVTVSQFIRIKLVEALQ